MTATSTPRLSEYARKFVFPPGIVRTVWPRVEAKGREVGLGFDWWQSQLGTVCLGYDEHGKYVATIGGVGMSIPRQVGKTYFVLALIVVMCILFPGLQVVWTAHHLRTSSKTFRTLRGICRRKGVAPHVLALRSANGEQQAEFKNGSMVMFGARSMGFGRGFDEIDFEVFDEAQILDTKALEDMIAATNQARHPHGALLFFMGTPPRPSDPSEAFAERRAEAWSGDSEDAIWVEFGADPKSDPNDRSQWPVMNPSYPLRTPLESMQRLKRNLKNEDSWNREGRGVWDDDAIHLDPITSEAWGLTAKDVRPDGPPVFFVTMAKQMSSATIAVASHASGCPHVELADHRHGVAWLPARVKELRARHPSAQFAAFGAGPVKALAPNFVEIGVDLVLLNGTEAGSAYAHAKRLVEESSFTHSDDPLVTAAIDGCAWKETDGGGAVPDWRNSTSELSPFVAEVGALWLLESTSQHSAPSVYVF